MRVLGVQDKVETTESVTARSTATTVGGVGRFWGRRIRTAAAAAAQAARTDGRTAARGVPAAADSGHGLADGRRSVGSRHVVFRRGGRRLVYRDAVPRCGQRREMELPDDGRGHRAKRVVRAWLSYVDDRTAHTQLRRYYYTVRTTIKSAILV